MRTAYVNLDDLEKVVRGEMTEEEYFAKHESPYSLTLNEDQLVEAIKQDEAEYRRSK